VPYLISVLAAVAGIVVLLTLSARLAGPTRRLVETLHRSRAHVADRTSLLAARIAALRVALDRRRGSGARSHSAPAA
jgi:HAMP domain-containing protein